MDSAKVRLESADIRGKVLIFGDLHISSTFQGKHKDYTFECYENMERIKDIVSKEGAKVVIFLGDIIGVNEKRLRDREFLMRVMNFFNILNKVTNGNVYSVKGNHDMGDFTDFDFLEGLGLIKNPCYLNYYGRQPGNNVDDGLEVRMHLVNYGDEHKSLKLSSDKDNASDIVLGHCDYYIEGVTNWYSANSNVNLDSLKNFSGISLVFSGHIHTPSEEILYTTVNNNEIGLFFLGSLGRVAEKYDDCWYLVFDYLKSETGLDWETRYDLRYVGLNPASEIYYDDADFEYDEESPEFERKNDSDKLMNIVKEIMDSRILTGDLNSQIDKIPGVSDEVRNIAKRYIALANG